MYFRFSYRQYQNNGSAGRGDQIVVLADRDGFWPRHRAPALSSRGTYGDITLICIHYLCAYERPLVTPDCGRRTHKSTGGERGRLGFVVMCVCIFRRMYIICVGIFCVVVNVWNIYGLALANNSRAFCH